MTAQKIILVTGANQGLGYCIVSVTATRDPSAHFILACRNVEAGNKAVDDLKKSGVTASLEVLKLDVTNDDEIVAAVDAVTAKHGRLDGQYSINRHFPSYVSGINLLTIQ
jgi:NAD(P)-dependent dehydrogenase (short-subunit alcohol dehydrogenase family)